jgi:hypothetical protein
MTKKIIIKQREEKSKQTKEEKPREATEQTEIQEILENSRQNLQNTNKILSILRDQPTNPNSNKITTPEFTSQEFNNPISKNNREMTNIPEIRELQSFANNTFIADDYTKTTEPNYTEYVNKETGAIISHNTADIFSNKKLSYYKVITPDESDVYANIDFKDNNLSIIEYQSLIYTNVVNKDKLSIYDDDGDGLVDYMATENGNTDTYTQELWEKNDDGDIIHTISGTIQSVAIRGKKNSNKNNQVRNLHRIIHSLQKRLHKKQR